MPAKTLSQPKPRQFGLRTLLAGLLWAALILAVCVDQQRAATRQRQNIELLKSAGLLPRTLVNGQPVGAGAPADNGVRTR